MSPHPKAIERRQLKARRAQASGRIPSQRPVADSVDLRDEIEIEVLDEDAAVPVRSARRRPTGRRHPRPLASSDEALQSEGEAENQPGASTSSAHSRTRRRTHTPAPAPPADIDPAEGRAGPPPATAARQEMETPAVFGLDPADLPIPPPEPPLADRRQRSKRQLRRTNRHRGTDLGDPAPLTASVEPDSSAESAGESTGVGLNLLDRATGTAHHARAIGDVVADTVLARVEAMLSSPPPELMPDSLEAPVMDPHAEIESATTTGNRPRVSAAPQRRSASFAGDPEDTPLPTPPPPPASPPPIGSMIVDRDAARLEAADEERTTQRVLRIGQAVYTGVVVTATAYWHYMVATLFLAVAVPLAAGWDTTTVMTGSMEPAISAGDVVAFQDWDGSQLGVGTIIRFQDPVRPGGTITHRVIGINADGTYTTKGDSNKTADSTPVPPETIVGVATMLAPHAGLPQLWWATQRLPLLGAWALGTTLALGIMSVDARSGPKRRDRKRVRLAVAIGLVAGIAGVGTAAWSKASFVASTSTVGDFAAESTFADFTHHGSLGTVACGTTSTVLDLTAAVPAGHTIVVRFAMSDPLSTATLGATDTKGNTYTVDADAINANQSEAAILSTYVTTPLVSGDRITVTHPNGRAVTVGFDEFSGVTSGTRLATAATATGNSSDPWVTIATPEPDTLIVANTVGRGSYTVSGPTGAWSPLGSGQAACQKTLTHASSWLEGNAAGSITFDPTFSRRSQFAAAAVAYRAG